MGETGASAGGRKFEGPGGTPGGLGEALGGLAMIAGAFTSSSAT
jgi:hypothetical protein